jgi:hypothetical protein
MPTGGASSINIQNLAQNPKRYLAIGARQAGVKALWQARDDW